MKQKPKRSPEPLEENSGKSQKKNLSYSSTQRKNKCYTYVLVIDKVYSSNSSYDIIKTGKQRKKFIVQYSTYVTVWYKRT